VWRILLLYVKRLSLYIVMEKYRGVEVYLHSSLTAALDGDE